MQGEENVISIWCRILSKDKTSWRFLNQLHYASRAHLSPKDHSDRRKEQVYEDSIILTEALLDKPMSGSLKRLIPVGFSLFTRNSSIFIKVSGTVKYFTVL